MQAFSYRGEVECICVDSSYDALVGATKEGALIIWSLSRCTLTRIIELGQYTVLSIVITPSFGFIFVYARTAIDGNLYYKNFLFSINGEKIKECESPHLTNVSVWRTNDAFDYILASDEDGNVFSFEAFEMTIPEQNQFIHFNSPILALKNNKNSKIGLAVLQNGNIFAFPITM